jgi:type III restriction enzyme
VAEKDTRWVVEAKADRDLAIVNVQGKRAAAQRWATHVSSDSRVKKRGERWKYLLVSESQLAESTDDWQALVATDAV